MAEPTLSSKDILTIWDENDSTKRAEVRKKLFEDRNQRFWPIVLLGAFGKSNDQTLWLSKEMLRSIDEGDSSLEEILAPAIIRFRLQQIRQNSNYLKPDDVKLLSRILEDERILKKKNLFAQLQTHLLGPHNIRALQNDVNQDNILEAANELTTLANKVGPRNRFEVKFPIVKLSKTGSDEGYLSSSIATLIERPPSIPPDQYVIYAPWSHLVITKSTDTNNLNEIAGHLLKSNNRLESHCVLIELNMLTRDQYSDSALIEAIYDLTPKKFDFAGSSLSLSVALAIYCVASKRVLRPLISTGEVRLENENSLSIHSVGGQEEKCTAILRYTECWNHSHCILMPPSWQKDPSLKKIGQLNKHDLINYFEETFDTLTNDSLLLTDGFDDLRESYAGESFSVDSTPKLPPDSKDLANGFVEEDLQTIPEKLKDSESIPESWYDLDYKKTERPFYKIMIPFGESTVDIANFIEFQLVTKWEAVANEKGWNDQAKLDQPVVMKIDFDRLSESPDAGAAQLADCVVSEHYISPAAIDLALQTPRKLVIVVYDSKGGLSLGEDQQRFCQKLELMKLLQANKGFHVIIAICDDGIISQFWDDSEQLQAAIDFDVDQLIKETSA